MTAIWLLILIVHGSSAGWQSTPALMWLLLIPMAFQDAFDVARARQADLLEGRIGDLEDFCFASADDYGDEGLTRQNWELN